MFGPKFRKKVKEWANRYGPPLVLATLTAVIVATLTYMAFGNKILSAVLGTWADNLVFYGIVAYRDIKARRGKDGKVTLGGFLKVMRNMAMEFGPAEYLDSFLIRPFLLAVFPLFISPYSLGVLVGSIAAEFTFFLPTILSYETRKKIFSD